MIQSIYVENYIIIEKVNLDLQNGFSCFSGETGAGKSLVIDALSILLGDKLTVDSIRKGQKSCLIGVTVDIVSPEALKLLSEGGFEQEEVFIFCREINLDNRSYARINGKPCTIGFMKEVLSLIIDIHSQHDNQYLLNKKFHLRLLDSYINSSSLAKVKSSFLFYKGLLNKYNDLKDRVYSQEERDFLLFQVQEIDQLALYEGEIEELEKRFKLLSSVEKITGRLESSLTILKNNHTKEYIWQCIKELEVSNDEAVVSITKKFKESYFLLEEGCNDLLSLQNSFEFSESEINEIQNRLFLIKKIQRKFGNSFQEISLKRDQMLATIAEIDNSTDVLTKLQNEFNEAHQFYANLAQEYSLVRKEAAKNLESDISIHLKDLSLQNSTFIVDFKTKEIASDGIDEIEFLMSTNLNVDPKPLVKVASGGELSRIMLGLKIIFSALQGVSTIIFDEIETGVSGTTAFAIGCKMKQLSRNLQVLAITHLAQVVACSNYHYYVNKLIKNNETITTVTNLSEPETIQQLAVLGFGMINEDSLNAAKLLLQQGRDA